MTAAASRYIPLRRSPLRFETKPIAQVESAAPRVPAIKNGVARLVADGPNTRENRETFVGNIHEVPAPERAAPAKSTMMELVVSEAMIPASIVKSPNISILFSLTNRNNSGAAARPKTKNRK